MAKVVSGRAAVLAVVWASICLSGAAAAQVLDIAVDGGVRVHAGPEVIVGDLDRAKPMRAPRARVEPDGALARAAETSGLSEQLISAVARQESGWNAAAISSKGARGLMQLMPATAAALGVDPNDPAANLQGGARYLAAMLQRFDGDLPKALAAYNAGPGAVSRYQGAPPYRETRRYVDAVLARLAVTASGDRSQ